MTDDQQGRRFWTELRGHAAFQIALVFAAGSWLAPAGRDRRSS